MFLESVTTAHDVLSTLAETLPHILGSQSIRTVGSRRHRRGRRRRGVMTIILVLSTVKERLKTNKRHFWIIQSLPCVNTLTVLHNLKDTGASWN